MKRMRKFWMAALGGVLFFCALLSAGMTVLQAQQTDNIFDSSRVRKTVLQENGFTLVTKENHDLPAIAIDLWIRAGTLYEDAENNGVSYLLETLLYKKYLKEALQHTGAEVNGSLSMDFIHFYATFPKEFLNDILQTFYKLLTAPDFTEEETNLVKQDAMDEIQERRKNIKNTYGDMVRKISFTRHPYSLPNMGNIDTIQKMTAKEINKYFKERFSPSNSILIVAGDLQPEQIEEQIKNLFGGMPSRATPVSGAPPEPSQTEPREVRLGQNTGPAYLVLSYHAPSVKDQPDVYAMDIILTLLGEGKQSRLHKKLREEKNLVEEVDVDFLTQKNPGLFIVTAKTDMANANKVKEEILKEIRSLIEKPVSKQELEKTKTLLENVVVLDSETLTGQTSFLGFYEAIDTMDFALTYLPEIWKITPQQVQETARKYFSDEKYNLLVISETLNP